MGFRIAHRASLLLAASMVACTAVTSACSRDVQAMTPQQIEQQYGVSGAYSDTLVTPGGSLKGTMVPVTLADGRHAQLVIPTQTRDDLTRSTSAMLTAYIQYRLRTVRPATRWCNRLA